MFGAYSILKIWGIPEFYDKLLIVPPLNLSVRMLDRFSERIAARFASLASWLSGRPRQVNYAWMGVWVCLFVTMTASGFLIKGADHPGSNPAFWANRCQEGRPGSCTTWVGLLKLQCEHGQSAQCLALGKILDEGRFVQRDESQSAALFGRACDDGLQEACVALIAFVKRGGNTVFANACDRGDGASCFLLGSLYSSGSGVPIDPSSAFRLFKRACEAQWWRACGRLGVSYLAGQGTPVSPDLAIASFEKGCQGRHAPSCVQAAQFYRSGKFGYNQDALARLRFQQACTLGLQVACQPAAQATKAPAPR